VAARNPLSLDAGQAETWRPLYEAVLAETDTRALFKRVEEAEAKILTHRESLERRAASHRERLVLDEALAYLAEVKKERLKFR
jgi:hypothetical protein